jgi:hypothetical protein
MVEIDELVDLIADIAGKRIGKKHIAGPLGVRGRNSGNRPIKEKLGWAPCQPLHVGLEHTYRWIETQVMRNSYLAPANVAYSRSSRSQFQTEASRDTELVASVS